MKVPFFKPYIDSADRKAVGCVLKTGILTNGPVNRELEFEFSTLMNGAHCVAVASCTDGLQLALETLPYKGKVAVPALTFTATAEAVVKAGHTPVFVDSSEDNMNMCPSSLEKAFAKHGDIVAVIPVAIGGKLCSPSIWAIAHDNSAVVIEDAAHALPSIDIEGSLVGAHPRNWATIFSFHPTKTMTAGEGGMIVTHQEALATLMRLRRLHGVDENGEVVMRGDKCNMSEIHAALALSQLRKLGKMHQMRIKVVRWYAEWFDKCRTPVICTTMPIYSEYRLHDFSAHLMIVLFKGPTDERPFKGVPAILNEMNAAGIQCRRHYRPLPDHQYWKNFPSVGHQNAMLYWNHSLSLPLYPGMKKWQVKYVVQQLTKILLSS